MQNSTKTASMEQTQNSKDPNEKGANYATSLAPYANTQSGRATVSKPNNTEILAPEGKTDLKSEPNWIDSLLKHKPEFNRTQSLNNIILKCPGYNLQLPRSGKYDSFSREKIINRCQAHDTLDVKIIKILTIITTGGKGKHF